MEHFTPIPKTRTAAQIEAARANGAKSRGPVTPEGKAVCARNALRHGHLAKMAVVPRESEDAFLELSHDIHAAFQPRDEHERSLVETMVLSSWRRSRCVAMESAALAQQMADHESALEVPTDQLVDPGHALYLATSTLASGDNAFTLLERYETRHTRAYERAARSLMLYRKFRQDDPAPAVTDPAPDIEQPPAEQPPADAPAAVDPATQEPAPCEPTPSEPGASEPGASEPPQTAFCQTNPSPASQPSDARSASPANPDKPVPAQTILESSKTGPNPQNAVLKPGL